MNFSILNGKSKSTMMNSLPKIELLNRFLSEAEKLFWEEPKYEILISKIGRQPSILKEVLELYNEKRCQICDHLHKGKKNCDQAL